ncbi:fructosamine kinase family protein [Thiomicrorhabdus arctica]|uniref:fructosamine kinase family protein n=1 Tax=Thiomicrorhabdus arctica TaxID=131540 RepID=UPI000370F790|nr:fructosamine kinase family protein [Thiomicrorhabdus arctica]
MDWQAFSENINQSLKEPFSPIQIQSAQVVSGGDIHQAYQLHAAGKDYFLKLNHHQYLPLFETERHSLNAIRHSKSITCPQPFATGTYNDQAWLLMAFIDLAPSKQPSDEVQRGRALAQMHHQINRDIKPFGWFENNFIGLNQQHNHWHMDWIEFYGQQRLKPQLELATLRNAPTSLYPLGMELIDQLPFWFKDYSPEASLLHGDLWGGNSAFDTVGEPIFYDPACYYGDRETDLAMTELFGGFTPDFYTGYNALYPLHAGYQSRKPLYNLYHILNHFNLFGGRYAQQAEKIIDQLLKTVQTNDK